MVSTGRVVEMRRRRAVLVAAVVAVVSGTAAAWMLARGDDEEHVPVEEVMGTVSLPPGWRRLPVPSDDRAAGVVFEAGRSEPAASIVVRRVRGRLAPDFEVEELAEETEAALAAEIEGFEPLDRALTSVASRDAVRLVWRQAAAGGVAFRSTMLILPTPREAFYFTLRAVAAEYRAVQADGERLLARLAEASMGG